MDTWVEFQGLLNCLVQPSPTRLIAWDSETPSRAGRVSSSAELCFIGIMAPARLIRPGSPDERSSDGGDEEIYRVGDGNADAENENEGCSCGSCGHPCGDQFMLICDRCETWYHGVCIIFEEASQLAVIGEEYICHDFRLSMIVISDYNHNYPICLKSYPHLVRVPSGTILTECTLPVANFNPTISSSAIED